MDPTYICAYFYYVTEHIVYNPNLVPKIIKKAFMHNYSYVNEIILLKTSEVSYKRKENVNRNFFKN